MIRGLPENGRSPTAERLGRMSPLPQRIRPSQRVRMGWFLALAAAHALLGVLCAHNAWIAFGHASGTLAIGLCLVLAGRPRIQLAYWGAYVVGAEVLWRMARAPLPWEFAKYALSLVLLLGFRRSWTRNFPWLPVGYFLLLLPATVQTLYEQPLGLAKDLISFNLSGPFSLAVCALFFSQVEMDSARIQRLLSWLVFPIASIAAAALFGLTTLDRVEFGSGSNFAATGGFGPNQVSAILGLGSLCLVLMVTSLRVGNGLRLAFVLLAGWFCAHAVLSFSRTGIYLLGASLLTAVPSLSFKRLFHPMTLIAGGLTILLGLGGWQYLDQFTGGKLGERFSNLSLTGRNRIANEDLAIWQEHFLLGAGIGRSSLEREAPGAERIAAHTEYTRLLSDHGLLGVLSLLLLIGVVVDNLLSRRPRFAKPVVIASTTWALLYLGVSGMRTAAPALLFGLGLARMTALPGLPWVGKRLDLRAAGVAAPAPVGHGV